MLLSIKLAEAGLIVPSIVMDITFCAGNTKGIEKKNSKRIAFTIL
jgi:hypothetical protein